MNEWWSLVWKLSTNKESRIKKLVNYITLINNEYFQYKIDGDDFGIKLRLNGNND